MTPFEFQERLLNWFDRHGRKDLPWQQDITPYRVWLSEIMLQQTQVKTVIPYFQAFTARFPTVESLAQSQLDEVLRLWAGLGYYARARNLHKAAQSISALGRFPDTLEGLMQLPGIGQSTAGAILSISFQQPTPILDGNVKRVLCRYYTISGLPSDSKINRQLWEFTAQLTPQERVADYTQAIMDLGATVCTRTEPFCQKCPVSAGCKAYQVGEVLNYPMKRQSKALPAKQLVFLILNDEQHVLLEKRPPTGIWGGLWSLPEFENEQSALAWCLQHNMPVNSQKIGIQQRHTFSHFHLDYQPVIVKTNQVIHSVHEADKQGWHNKAELTKLGLPKPVKALLLQQFFGDNTTWQE